MTDTTNDLAAEIAAHIFEREPQQQEQQQDTTDTTDELAQTRADLAKKYLLSDEDRDILLTGTDAATLEKQAQRLFARTPHNVAPKEGNSPGVKDDPLAEFARQLFTGTLD